MTDFSRRKTEKCNRKNRASGPAAAAEKRVKTEGYSFTPTL